MINSAGYNIYPRTPNSRNSSLEHGAVAGGAIEVGIPDDAPERVPKAYVVTVPNVRASVDVTEEEIQGCFLDNVASPLQTPRAGRVHRRTPANDLREDSNC